MNDPHSPTAAGNIDETIEVAPEYATLMRKVYEVIMNNQDAEATSEQVAELVLAALNGDLDEELSHSDGPGVPHTQGSKIDNRLESQYRHDAAGLMSQGTTDDLSDLISRIKPRKMSRQELQRAADKLVGISVKERRELDALESHRAQRQGTRPTLTRKQLADDGKRLMGGR